MEVAICVLGAFLAQFQLFSGHGGRELSSKFKTTEYVVGICNAPAGTSKDLRKYQ
jgi:hypothetical protein